MTDLIPVITIASLIGNAVLLIAYGNLYRNSVRRDPRTGRYLKKGN